MPKETTKKEKKKEHYKWDENHHHDRFALGLIIGIAVGVFIISIGLALSAFVGTMSEVRNTVNLSSYVNNRDVDADEDAREEEDEDANDDEDTNDEGTNENEDAEGTGDIDTGGVELNMTDLETIQTSVDNGSQPWRLDPVMVASADGVRYGFSIEDTYRLSKEPAIGEGSGTGEAEVEIDHGGKTFVVQLIQPVKTGDDGVWAINSIRAK